MRLIAAKPSDFLGRLTTLSRGHLSTPSARGKEPGSLSPCIEGTARVTRVTRVNLKQSPGQSLDELSQDYTPEYTGSLTTASDPSNPSTQHLLLELVELLPVSKMSLVQLQTRTARPFGATKACHRINRVRAVRTMANFHEYAAKTLDGGHLT